MCVALTAQSPFDFVGDSFLIWTSNAVHSISLNTYITHTIISENTINREKNDSCFVFPKLGFRAFYYAHVAYSTISYFI